MKRPLTALCTVAVVGAALLPAAGPGAAAPTPATLETPAAAEGALQGAPGLAPADETITFYLVMKRSERAARSALRRVSDPTSPRYRQFPSRSAIASRFGATPAAVRSVRRSAAAAGASAQLDDTGLFMRITGTVAELTRWSGQPIQRQVQEAPFSSQSLQREALYFAGSTRPPASVARVATDLLPIFVRVKTFSAISTSARPVQPNTGTYVGGCRAARRQNTYSFRQLATAYGTAALPGGQTVGRASRMAILASGEGFSQRALNRSADCFDLPGRTFVRHHVDGMIGNLPEGGEGDLDTQVAQAVLPPGSRITVIESPSSAATWFLGWAAAFGLPQLPDAVSQSYGLCERNLATEGLLPATRSLTDSILVRLGLAGTTATASAGDDGSSDCFESDQTIAPAIDYPSSSPFITALGGSRIVLNPANHRRTEHVWRDVNRTMTIDGRQVPAPTSGGGGGDSVVYRRPWFQSRWTDLRTARRTTPDISMHASFGPGWPVYLTTPAAQASQLPDGGFYAIAGTSASSPYFASAMARMAAGRRVAGQPAFGHAAPALYQMAQRPGAVFDITKVDNDLYDVGCCTATPGYDRASGVGAPNLARIDGLWRRPGG